MESIWANIQKKIATKSIDEIKGTMIANAWANIQKRIATKSIDEIKAAMNFKIRHEPFPKKDTKDIKKIRHLYHVIHKENMSVYNDKTNIQIRKYE